MAASQATERPNRELEFDDGSSRKFWRIALSGSSHTVTFGRIGTNGQTQTKEFDSEDAAANSYDKLVAEKLKKGYAETQTGAAPAPVAKAPTATPKATPVKKAASSKSKAAVEAAPTAPLLASMEIEPLPEPAREPVVEHELRLTDEDRALAGLLDAPPPRSEPRPFDQAECVRELSKLRTAANDWNLHWSSLELPRSMSREEAHFWFAAMTAKFDKDLTAAKLAERLLRKTFDGNVSVDVARKQLEQFEYHYSREIALVLANLFTPEEVIQAALGARDVYGSVLHHVVGYWSLDERRRAADAIRRAWDPTPFSTFFGKVLPQCYYFAAELGMTEEIGPVVASWKDDRYALDSREHREDPHLLVLRLGSPEHVAREWRRLKLRMRDAEMVRWFLAVTGFSALDCVRDGILSETNKDTCERKVQALGLAVAPETAPFMLECRLSSRAPVAARQWLEDHRATAITGLIPTAAGKGKLADAAVEFLRQAKRNGYADFIASAIDRLADPAAAAALRKSVIEFQEREYTPFDDRSTPTWLTQALDGAGQLKLRPLPGWANPASLPPITVGEQRLNEEQITTVLQTLAATVGSGRHALFDALHEHADPQSLDEFAWRIFQAWLGDGAPPKEKWGMGAIGLLGGDICAVRITPLLRAWPGESQHQRAVFGLECLRAIGSNTALMQLAGIAQKLKFKGLKAKAEEYVEAIARDKGLTRAQLEDRVVPDCGLDEHGRREFSFGSRSFSFVLGPDLKPLVRDPEGKVRGDLPKPSGKDDAEIAQASLDEWKFLKKQIRDVAKIQATRLEQAMVTGRRWNVDEFESLLVQHPLMTHLARTLLWGAYDADGRLRASFRITDELDYADSKEHPVSLRGFAQVGIIHPLHLNDQDRSAWGEILSDYEIVPPFRQLGRPVHSLEPKECTAHALDRYKGMKVPSATLVFGLEKLGWQRGAVVDAGSFDEHSKQFPGANVTVVVEYDGFVGVGYINPDDFLTVTSCAFVNGLRKPSAYAEGLKEKLKLGDVDPIVISEVITDMDELQSKAR